MPDGALGGRTKPLLRMADEISGAESRRCPAQPRSLSVDEALGSQIDVSTEIPFPAEEIHRVCL